MNVLKNPQEFNPLIFKVLCNLTFSARRFLSGDGNIVPPPLRLLSCGPNVK